MAEKAVTLEQLLNGLHEIEKLDEAILRTVEVDPVGHAAVVASLDKFIKGRLDAMPLTQKIRLIQKLWEEIRNH